MSIGSKQLWLDPKTNITYTVWADRRDISGKGIDGAIMGYFYEVNGVTESSPLHPKTRGFKFVRVEK